MKGTLPPAQQRSVSVVRSWSYDTLLCCLRPGDVRVVTYITDLIEKYKKVKELLDFARFYEYN